MQHAELSGNNVLAWIHNETACNYRANSQTHKSMSLAISTDYGLTWKSHGQIIIGKDVPTAGKITGEGDCTAVNGQDGYYYAYCWRNRNGATIIARAPVSDPRPGEWMKFFQGKWDQPGLGGDSTGLKGGGGVARWTTTGETLLLGWTNGGMGLHFSTDRTTFTTLREPLMLLDRGIWNRPDPSEVVAYQDLLDAKTGTNQLSNSWLMVYMYLQPNEGFDKRYLIFRNVEVSISNSPVTPQVGVLLARWYNAKLHDRWSTTAPVPPANGSAYKLETRSGFLMTVADAKPSVKLEDCVSQWPGILIICLKRNAFAMPATINGYARRAGLTANPRSRLFLSAAATTTRSTRTLLRTSQIAKVWGRPSACSGTHRANNSTVRRSRLQ